MTAAKASQSDSVKTVRSSRTFHIGDAILPAATLDPGLYVVATPIGNLADVTLRALAILAGADAILAEDTRVSRTLLARYGIERPLSPYHEHNAAETRPRALKRIAEGQALALISDAGTPLISDPGYKLVAGAIELGFAVAAAPGPSAALAALCVAGLPTDRFYFEGFPRPGNLRDGSGSTRSRPCPARWFFTKLRDGWPRRSLTLRSSLGRGRRRWRAN
jgi:16S rRNA (cytidine1402-2'-O)-methyltransferase